MRVAVLAGGRSSEHEVSLRSGAAVMEGLLRAGHEVVWVELDRDGVWRHDGAEVALHPGRGLLGADAAFPVLHGPFGEDGTVQGLLELLDVPYVGSGVLASALCMDKVAFKQLMAHLGLPQVRFVAVDHVRWTAERAAVLAEVEALGFPSFGKPARLGSSVGIVRIAAPEEVGPALDEAFRHDPRAIVEAGAPGLEVECSVLGHTTAAEASAPGEIVVLRSASPGGWYDYEAKYTPDGMRLQVPARISPSSSARVRELAVTAFREAGCSGLARADFFVDGEDVLLNELNTMPGFTQTSVYGKLWEASGVPYPELCDRLVTIARERHARERRYRF
ncbi:MAG TPA: D-alanine--D-alanine ligase family protein [Solirubrobacteraceae bacterium]|nr:D-alanine--D-alanine ligase family protein [Solirubrobacteraceae bacterium]